MGQYTVRQCSVGLFGMLALSVVQKVGEASPSTPRPKTGPFLTAAVMWLSPRWPMGVKLQPVF
jgi:hypothetical protein